MGGHCDPMRSRTIECVQACAINQQSREAGVAPNCDTRKIMGRREQKERERKRVAKSCSTLENFLPASKSKNPGPHTTTNTTTFSGTAADAMKSWTLTPVVGESSKYYGGCGDQRLVDSLESSSSLHGPLLAGSLLTQSQRNSDNPVNDIVAVCSKMGMHGFIQG